MSIPCYGIIPARYASTRFPGKSLVEIAGKPMIWHVYERSRRCTVFRSVTLATDDVRIGRVADELGMAWVMTSEDHQSGTDRVYEAACKLGVEDDAVVINIQGDEPMVEPSVFVRLLEPFADPTVEVSTLATPIQAERACAPNQVKLVLAANGNALYFSRALVPYARDEDPETLSYLGHIGLYAFRMRALRRFVQLPPSYLERTERLEQLRLIENNIPIRVVLTAHHSPGVDTPEDLERVRQLWVPAG